MMGTPKDLSLYLENPKKSGDTHITVPNKTIEVVVKFKVRGNLRFLSHAEMLKVFQRACVRAGIKTAHSQGFNPRPKLSLPLPRSVGIETDDDLLCVRVETSASSFDSEQFKNTLSSQLPEGCEPLTVSMTKAKTLFQAGTVTYVLAVRPKHLNEKLKARVKHLLASESLNLQRRTNSKNLKFKKVNVRPFLKSIELDDRNKNSERKKQRLGRGFPVCDVMQNGTRTHIVIECRITSAGSIRVDEILDLLELDYGMLAAPIRRMNIQWIGDC